MDISETHIRIGKLMQEAIGRRKDRPKLAVLEYMMIKLEEAKIHNVEPDWKRIFKESRRIWEANL